MSLRQPPYGNHATNPRDERGRRDAAARMAKAERRCMVPECPRRPRLVTLPLSERRIWVCGGHRPGLTIGAMRQVVAHG